MKHLDEVIGELEELLRRAPHVPLLGRALVAVEDVHPILERLRQAVPDLVRQAERVLKERDRILGQAREEAEAMVKEAQAYVERLARESVIAQRAEEEASRIREEAYREGREVRQGARQYADEVLEKLESSLQRCLTIIRQSRESLAPGKAEEEAVSGPAGSARA